MKLIKYITLSVLLSTFLLAQENEYRVETHKINDNLYEIYTYIDSNLSVNLYVFKGDDGVLLIDSGMDVTVDRVKSELGKIGVKNIKYIINTHNDGDHVLGNPVLGKNATIISHENLRPYLVNDARFKEEGVPNVTFTDSMKIYFNNEEIILRHIPGHTNNDIYIEFKNANLLFMGDMAFENSFPIVHNNGDIYKLVESLQKIKKHHSPGTQLICSHGKPTKVSELDKYIRMINETRDIVVKAINNDMPLQEAINKNILKDYESWNSNVFATVNVDRWISTLYSLTNEGKAKAASINLEKQIDNHGLSYAKENKEEFKNRKDLIFSENDINALGYQYLFAGKTEEAIFVFTINTELYPESANVFDSLGEAYYNAGKMQESLKNYKKSLLLNPKNTNAVNMIKKITKK